MKAPGNPDGPLQASRAAKMTASLTHTAIPGSQLVVLPGAPHGCNVSHADAFNSALLEFLAH